MYTQLDLNRKSVLITGGAGFIGSNLALHIQERWPECEIVVFDAFVLGHFKNLLGFQGTCISGDIANAADRERLEDYRFDYIFHQAAISDTTETDQQHMVRVNTNALADILRIARRMSAVVVYASSAGTYGNSPAPNHVGAGEAPENVYGFSKLMMDHLGASLAKKHNQPVVGLRYFNVYGPREFYKGSTASMILQLGRRILAGERPRLFKHGEQLRDFVYVEDVIQANLNAVSAKASGVYNVGSGEARSFNDLLDILGRELGAEIDVEYVDNPWAFYQNHTEADIGPTRAALGYAPAYSLEEGIRAYLPEILRLCGRQEAPCYT
jgi:ADP-L-glycero-D-manno-heptose 6-epimerase